jgi:ferredoxin
MKQMPRKSKPLSADTSSLLAKSRDEEGRKRREELLASLGVEEFFAEGKITINNRTCKGLECKLCISACPTNALFWKAGEVGIVEELCVYCGACVLSCIVDDCIKIVRKRANGELERFSKPNNFIALQYDINAKKRFESVKDIFPETEGYFKRHKWKA